MTTPKAGGQPAIPTMQSIGLHLPFNEATIRAVTAEVTASVCDRRTSPGSWMSLLIFYFYNAHAPASKNKSWHLLEIRRLQKSSHRARHRAVTAQVAPGCLRGSRMENPPPQAAQPRPCNTVNYVETQLCLGKRT